MPPVAAPHRTKKDRRLSLEEVGGMLVADGLAAADAVARLVENRRLQRSDVHPLVTLANERWRAPDDTKHALHGKALTLDGLTEWLAGRVGLDYFHIDPLRIDFAQVTDIMSAAYAERYRILPVGLTSEEALIATAEPHVREWEEEIARLLRKKIRRVLANPVDIARYVIEFYNLARSVKRAAQIGDGRAAGGFEQLVDIGAASRQYDANDQHIVNIVDWLWQYAFDQRASDIHVEPRRDVGVVRFRIDGVLHEVYRVPASVVSAMTSRIKILGRMDVVEKRRPQDGRIKTRASGGQEIELRLSTLPTAFGEKLVMRIFDPDVLMKDFAELGFAEDDRARWTQMTERPHGIVLVTGPTGSGKTTTLYSTLKQLATSEVNVCTIEDPIEMVEPAFNQMQVQGSIDLGFAEGVRALMRQDPDIIMIGEIRDRETAEMAVQAALTSHLVLSTLHTNDAASAVTRLMDIGVPPYMLGATVLGVMAQRLVRTLCVRCKERVPWEGAAAGQIDWDALVAPFTARKPSHLWRPVGCLECRMTGYRGRAGLYEVMLLSPELRKLIGAGADLAAMRAVAYREGMKPLRISGAMKVAAGVTTVEEVVKTTPPPEGAEV